VYLPPEDITELNMPIEEAMKLIVSGGAYLPSRHGWHPDDEPWESDEHPALEESPEDAQTGT
jgi:uncharacterized membrane protein